MAESQATENAFQSPVVRPPKVQDIVDITRHLGINASDEELLQYHEIATDVSKTYDTWSTIPEATLSVLYPRTTGYKPQAQDNPYNAWAWRTEIFGAKTGKLAGRSIAVKDSIPVAGVPMRNGSAVFSGFTPDFDATIVTRVLAEGGVIRGKSACEDLCSSASSFTNYGGPVSNPHDTTRTTGGSSSGSAALVAAGLVDMALGTDQGGSVRIPSSCCGIVGLKPTHGLVPYTGILGMDSAVDYAGPMARSVKDCALLLEVIAGYDSGLDPRQPANVSVQEYSKNLSRDLSGIRVGILKEGFQGKDSDVDQLVRSAAYRLREAGAEVEEVSIPIHLKAIGVWSAICREGFYRNMFMDNGVGHGWEGFYPSSVVSLVRKSFPSDVNKLAKAYKSNMIAAEYVNRNYGLHFYARAMNVLRTVRKEYDDVMKRYDVIVMPTVTRQVPKLPTQELEDNLKEYRQHAYEMTTNTCQFNATGHPALSIRAGFLNNLPVGMQIVGRHFEDSTVLRVAYAFECLREGNIMS